MFPTVRKRTVVVGIVTRPSFCLLGMAFVISIEWCRAVGVISAVLSVMLVRGEIMDEYAGKTAITFGVFDLLHFGHFELFRKMREMVDSEGKVYVMLQIDEMVEKYKPGCITVYDFVTRRKMIETLRTVDKVIPYDTVGVDAVKGIDFDILVVGPEHTNERFQRLFAWCHEKGKEIVTLPRTEGISTTRLKELIRNLV